MSNHTIFKYLCHMLKNKNVRNKEKMFENQTHILMQSAVKSQPPDAFAATTNSFHNLIDVTIII